MADGIAATARVITAAAAVMVVVFSSFLLNDERVVNLFGFGLAVAIAIDATIVRLVLVPALMAVAGKSAWYMPRWLDRLLPKVALEPAPFDPFEHEPDSLDELDLTTARPRHADTSPSTGSPSTDLSGQVAILAPTTSIDLSPASVSSHALDPYEALEQLRTALDEREDYRNLYEQAVTELAALQQRYDALRHALGTLRSAADEDGGASPAPSTRHMPS